MSFQIHPQPSRPAIPGSDGVVDVRRESASAAARVIFLLLFGFTFTGSDVHAQEPYRNPVLSVDERIDDLLARMTPEEKFWQLFMIPGDLDDNPDRYQNGLFGFQVSTTGRDGDAAQQMLEYGSSGTAREAAVRINDIQRWFARQTRLGIPIIPFDEGLHGLIRSGATAFPQSIGLAATFDTLLVGQVARAIAAEMRSRGIRQVLSPVLNLARDVRWGRTEETYGEDPHLTSMMGLAYVRAFEQAGVAATPKHFVANVGAGGRDSYPVHYSERYLEQVHFPAFRTAVQQGGARSIMTAYNSVNGLPATASPFLMRQKLKEEWDFDGFVISDASGTGGSVVLHNTAEDYADAGAQAVNAGLDVIFQTAYEHADLFRPAFEDGHIPPDVLDEAVSRVLRVKFELGLFEDPYVDPDLAERINGSPEHRTLALEAARSSVVLLTNRNAVLPLDSGIGTVAVIGTDADEARLGGYSGPGNDVVSLLDGLRAHVGEARVQFAPGPGRASNDYTVIEPEYLFAPGSSTKHGLAADYFDDIHLNGTPALQRTDRNIDFGWTLYGPDPSLPFDWYSVRWRGGLLAPESGSYRVGIEGNDGYRLYLGDSLLIDNWTKRSFDSQLVDVELSAGIHDLRLEFFESTGGARIRLVWDFGVHDDAEERIREAAALARRSDAAIIAVGIEEGEFRDRASLRLPGRQEELIRAVADTQTPVIVVLFGGSAVTMGGWLDRAHAIIAAWYPGEAGGTALADVLFGDVNPSGRLPITYPVSEGQLPLVYNHHPTGRGDDYLDLTGEPLFPFGYGLSYTTFEYSDIRIDASAPGDDVAAVVSCTIRNTGERSGHEVVQLYVTDELATTTRPTIELKAFERIHLSAGASKTVEFELDRRQFEMLDTAMRRVVEPGRFRIMIGRSSSDIRLRGFLHLD